MERSPIHLVGLLNCKNALAMIFHNKNVEDFLIVFNRYIPIHENRKVERMEKSIGVSYPRNCN